MMTKHNIFVETLIYSSQYVTPVAVAETGQVMGEKICFDENYISVM